MKLSTKHIYIVAGIILFLLLGYWVYTKFIANRPKTVTDLKQKAQNITNYSPSNNPSTPPMYGAQPVVYQNGLWMLSPGTCELVTNGIVDWQAVQMLSDSQKDQLYRDIENCKAESLPLLQP